MRPSLFAAVTAALLAIAPGAFAAAGTTAGRFAELQAAEQTVAQQRKAAEAPGLTARERRERLQELAGPMQTLATLQSFAGAEREAMATFDAIGPMLGAVPSPAAPTHPAIAWALARDAVASIVDEARNRQIVILNEAQHVPMQRAFAMLLARELRKIGFTHLACECFAEAPLAKGYLTAASGYYIGEPTFANFLREAREQQWVLVPYEYEIDTLGLGFGAKVRGREQGQADNLIKRVLRTDPRARIFIYGAYDHVREKNSGADSWMAAHLRERSGIDPLTIDQSLMIAHEQAAAHPLYAQLAAKISNGKPVVLTRTGTFQVFGNYAGEVDMQVVHPPYPVSPATGRPAWMTTLAGWKAQPIPSELLPASGRRLIEARRKGAPADEVPVDAVLVHAGQKAPMIMAPPGELTFSVAD